MILLTAIEYLRDDSILPKETFTSYSSKRGTLPAHITDESKLEDKETVDAWPEQRRQKNGKIVLFTGLKALGKTTQYVLKLIFNIQD